MSNERQRLNRRIHSITGTQLSRDLKYYRKFKSSKQQVQLRGAAVHMVTTPSGRKFLEPVDIINICHNWLDEHNVQSCTEDP